MLVLGLFCFLTLIIVSLSQGEKQDDLKSLLDGHSAGSANLVEHQHRYLRMQHIMCSDFVYDSMQCALNCLVAVRCRSFNFKMQVELDGRHLCEILASDKYNHSTHLEASSNYYHYSILVRAIMYVFLIRYQLLWDTHCYFRKLCFISGLSLTPATRTRVVF